MFYKIMNFDLMYIKKNIFKVVYSLTDRKITDMHQYILVVLANTSCDNVAVSNFLNFDIWEMATTP